MKHLFSSTFIYFYSCWIKSHTSSKHEQTRVFFSHTVSTRLLLLLNKRLRLTFAAAVAAFQSEPEGSFAVDPAGKTLAAAAAVAAAAGVGSARGASSQPVGSESIAVAAAAVAAAVAVVVAVVGVVDISFARPLDQAVSLLGVLVAS